MKLTKQQGDDLALILDQVLHAWDFSGDDIELGHRLEKLLKKLQYEVDDPAQK